MCIWNSAFKHTAWSTSLSPREADDAGLAQFDFTHPVSRKNKHAHFSTEGGGDCDTCHRDKRGDMATETVVALDSNFKLLLMSRILVAVEKMVASCYNHSGCALVIARRGETTPSGVWHQQYTHNHVWSLKQKYKHVFTIFIISPHWHDTGSWNFS